MRLTPLTDRLVAHLKLNSLSLNSLNLNNLKLNNLKLNTRRVADLKFGEQRLGELRLGRLSHRGKTLAYGGTALALAGIGGVTAVAATPSAPAAFGIAATSRNAAVEAGGVPAGTGTSIDHLAASAVAQSGATAFGTAQLDTEWAAGGSGHPQAHGTRPGGAHPGGVTAFGTAQLRTDWAAGGSAQPPAHSTRPGGTHPGGNQPGSTAVSGSHVGGARADSATGSSAQSERGLSHARAGGSSPHVVRHAGRKSWRQIRDELASQTSPRPEAGKLPLADRLLTGPASGPQSYLPIGASQMANATTIVGQALGKHMGLRAAVIAVATAMQESGLENINYGDRDSLGLFQQRPSMGWGTAKQITTPSYAADAFLNALAQHQKADPGWAGQPLWATAQAVQNSGFPYAYAKWERQAAQLVTAIATRMG